MTDGSLFTGVNLFDHVGAWRCAIFATDAGLQFKSTRESIVDGLRKLLQEGTQERDAWQQVFRTHMSPVLVEHAELRRHVNTKPKHVAKMLASWFENYQALQSKPFTSFHTLAQRLQALASTAPRDTVEHVFATPTKNAEQVQHALVREHGVELALSSAITCLVVLAQQVGKHPAVPFVCGSLTPAPVTWSNVPVIKQVETETGLPAPFQNSWYAILCYTPGAEQATIRVLCERGEEKRLDVQLPAGTKPLWLSTVSSAPSSSSTSMQQLVIGCTSHVGLVQSDGSHTSWTSRDTLPLSNHCEKMNQYVAWQQGNKLFAIHVQNTCLLEDEEEVHQLCLRHVQTGVAACNNVVYSNGMALFMLPPDYQLNVAAVHRLSHDTVDVFTTVGDWWRVHVPTLSAYVVGLDIYPSVVVDACVFY